MKKSMMTLLLVGAGLFLTGCADKVPNYAPSAQNMRMIKNIQSEENISVTILPFSAKNEGESKVMCRLSSPIGAPDGMTFAKYIEDALTTELELGGMYSPKAKVQLQGRLEDHYGSTILGNAYWSYKVTLTSSNGKSLTVESRYDYESSFTAYSACKEMQRSYLPAVQKLVNDIVKDPRFKELLK